MKYVEKYSTEMRDLPNKTSYRAHLGDVLQPAAEGHKHKQHRGCVKEGHGAGGLLHHHGCYHHAQGVHVGDGGGQHDEHIHVGCLVTQCFEGLYIKVPSSNKLEKK